VPVLARDTGVVEFSGENLEGFVVEGEMVSIDGKGVRLLSEKRVGDEKQETEEDSFHLEWARADEATLVHLRECFKGEFNVSS
jgi:hypothetical protein